MGRKKKPLNLSIDELTTLNQLISNASIDPRVHRRAKILIRTAAGESNLSVATDLSISKETVVNCRNRFLKARLTSLVDKPRSGRPGNKAYAKQIELIEEEKRELQRLSSRRKINQAIARRARIVLGLAEGKTQKTIAGEERISTYSVRRCRNRFIDHRLDGLQDAPRPGAPRKIMDEEVERVIAKTLESIPQNATHWSIREMAKETGLASTTISRIWHAFGLQPHRTETFKLSTDPYFIEKVRDVVGLYLDPPEKAVVLCVDEKSQIQALDRTQPIIPIRPGIVEKQTHDYRRHGTSSLFAALNILTGKVIGKCYRKHRAIEFKKFLNIIEKEVPEELDIHIVLDNYSTHKTAAIHRWLLKRPRYHLHFTPTSSSWLNLVERWFGELTQKKIRRGSYRSVRNLEQSIHKWVETYNEDSKPYVWTKTADEIFNKIKNFCGNI